MKSVKILMLFLLAGSVVFNACKKKDDPKAPNIAVTGGKTEAAPGEDVTYKITIGSEENKLSKLEVSSSVNGNAGGVIFDTTFSSATNTAVDYIYTVSSSAKNDDDIVLTFTVTDNQGLTNTSTQSIKVKYAAGDINTYQAKLLGGASNPDAGSFFDAHAGTVMFMADANANQDKVDIIYTYSTDNKHMVAAPDDLNIAQAHTNVASWTTKNPTRFQMTAVTKAQFDAITDDAMIVAEANGANDTRVTDLAAGEVFAFTTSDGKKGLVYVVNVGGSTPETREMTIDVKVQK